MDPNARVDAYFGLLEHTKVSAGGGLRFLLSPKERLALRLDYGRGFDTGSSGFYISLGEAF